MSIAQEVQNKIESVRAVLAKTGASGARFKGTDWFSWITGGGHNVVLMAAETGIADVLVTATKAVVLTNDIESLRLTEEQLPKNFEVLVSHWQDLSGADKFVRELCGNGKVLCDRPDLSEEVFPKELQELKLVLGAEEIARYKTLGSESAQAMTESLGLADPTWTENRLAAEGARALWKRGIHPTLILVAGAKRLEKHRHPFPTTEVLGHRAMMVFCARRNGLFACFSRFVSFARPTPTEVDRMKKIAEFESALFEASKPGAKLSQIFDSTFEVYKSAGFENETRNQHFGGITGYNAREAFARPAQPGQTDWSLNEGMALAWNPTLPGSKIEDTVLVTKSGVESVTIDPQWPKFELDGRMRPDVWVRA
jgi:Xaa-Pro aminopeptidase